MLKARHACHEDPCSELLAPIQLVLKHSDMLKNDGGIQQVLAYVGYIFQYLLHLK